MTTIRLFQSHDYPSKCQPPVDTFGEANFKFLKKITATKNTALNDT